MSRGRAGAWVGGCPWPCPMRQPCAPVASVRGGGVNWIICSHHLQPWAAVGFLWCAHHSQPVGVPVLCTGTPVHDAWRCCWAAHIEAPCKARPASVPSHRHHLTTHMRTPPPPCTHLPGGPRLPSCPGRCACCATCRATACPTPLPPPRPAPPLTRRCPPARSYGS